MPIRPRGGRPACQHLPPLKANPGTQQEGQGGTSCPGGLRGGGVSEGQGEARATFRYLLGLRFPTCALGTPPPSFPAVIWDESSRSRVWEKDPESRWSSCWKTSGRMGETVHRGQFRGEPTDRAGARPQRAIGGRSKRGKYPGANRVDPNRPAFFQS